MGDDPRRRWQAGGDYPTDGAPGWGGPRDRRPQLRREWGDDGRRARGERGGDGTVLPSPPPRRGAPDDPAAPGPGSGSGSGGQGQGQLGEFRGAEGAGGERAAAAYGVYGPATQRPRGPLLTQPPRSSYAGAGLGAAVPIGAGTKMVGAPSPSPAAQRGAAWGWLPALSVTSACGLILGALSAQAGRLSQPQAEPLLWCGLLVIALPIVFRMVFFQATSYERLGLAVVLAEAIYGIKVLQYPLAFTYHDEYAHWRTVSDIVATGHLFAANPIIPISAEYPGMELCASALSSVSGLSVFISGLIVIGVARLLLTVALFLVFESVTGSSRVAGIGTVVYAMNPHFLFFDSSFSYESFALPLAVFVVACLALRTRIPRADRGVRRTLTAVAWIGFAGVVVSHHLTSYALAGFLLAWTLAAIYVRRRRGMPAQVASARDPGVAPLVGIELIVVWLFAAGGLVISYLAPHAIASVRAILGLLLGSGQQRQLFSDYAGSVTPLWARAAAFGAVGLILVGAMSGLWVMWRRYPHALGLALASATLLYPISQAFRLTQAGAESADRATEFLFLGMAFSVAILIVVLVPHERLFGHVQRRWEAARAGGAGAGAGAGVGTGTGTGTGTGGQTRRGGSWGPLSAAARPASWPAVASVMACMLVLFVGGVVAGGGPEWNWVPGPYLVSADSHSVEAEGIDAALWMGTSIGSHKRVATDRTNSLLMGAYADENVLTSLYVHAQIAPLFTSPRLGIEGLRLLERTRAQYIEVDMRLSTQLPRLGEYFDDGEPGVHTYTRPIAAASLDKFDGISVMSRLYDSGDIQIYRVAL